MFLYVCMYVSIYVAPIKSCLRSYISELEGIELVVDVFEQTNKDSIVRNVCAFSSGCL